jgi:hypothetical protein
MLVILGSSRLTTSAVVCEKSALRRRLLGGNLFSTSAKSPKRISSGAGLETCVGLNASIDIHDLTTDRWARGSGVSKSLVLHGERETGVTLLVIRSQWLTDRALVTSPL